MANLRGELRNAVSVSFKEGTKKREYKQTHSSMDEKVFSYNSRKALFDRAGDLAAYIKNKYPEIRHVKEIHNKHIREYLKSKEEAGCSKATVRTYFEQLKKIAKCCNAAYKSVNAQWGDIRPPERATLQDRIRKDAMTQEQYQNVLESGRQCSSLDGIRLGRNFGLRVQEIPRIRVSDVDLERGTLQIYRSKGGRTWKIPIETVAQRQLLERLIADKTQQQPLIPVRKESLNRYLHQLNDKAGNTNLLEQKAGFHAIRKMVAQERYDMLRKSGVDKKDALDDVNHYLGHGDDRKTLSDTYVADQW